MTAGTSRRLDRRGMDHVRRGTKRRVDDGAGGDSRQCSTVSELATLVDRYTVDRNTVLRRYPAEFTPERYERLTKFYNDWQQQLSNVPYAPLGAEGRIDHTLLKSRVEYELRLLGREQAWLKDTSALMPFARDITTLVEARGRVEMIKPDHVAGALDGLASAIETATKSLDGKASANAGGVVADTRRARQDQRDARGRNADQPQGQPRRVVALLFRLRPAVHVVDGAIRTRRPTRRWPRTSGRCARRSSATRKATTSRSSATRSAATRSIADLQSEFVPYTPEELLKIAEREFAWCERGDAEGVARDGLRRRLEGRARKGQDAARRARQADRAGPRPRARSRATTSTKSAT